MWQGQGGVGEKQAWFMRQAVVGPLGEVGMHDRPLEIRAQKYVSKVDSGLRAPQLPRTSRRHRDWGRSRTSWMEGGIRTFQGWAHISP